MMRRLTITLASAALAALAGCQGGTKETVQVGYRGVGQELAYDRTQLANAVLANKAPAPLAPAAEPSPPAQWQNVQVLTDVSANEFNRTMLAMTQWVSPEQSCAYCHNPVNFASDEKYTKVVSRRMLQMTRALNNDWKSHVQGTGVTCYTCHRGQPVPPAGVWYFTDENQYIRAYLDRSDVRVQSQTVAHTDDNNTSIRQATNTYALMMGMSRALGVNCTYCHNSRSWTTWQNAPPARITALYGLRMVRDLNTNYLTPLTAQFPSYRLGPHGDAPKLQCLTCHQGLYKPLAGAQMVKDYPALWGAPTWSRGGASDTVNAGFVDLRSADSVAVDGSPRLPGQRVDPAPAPNAPGAAAGMTVRGAGTPAPAVAPVP